jgi:phosphoglycerate dehydrogenase-like enzyme
MAPRLSRRAMLSLLAAAGAASATFAWLAGPEDLVGKIIRRRFPGVRVNATAIAALTRDVKAAKFQTFGRKLALESGARAAGILGLDLLAQWKLTAKEFSQLERRVVTIFITGSDFLDVTDPKSDVVTYVSAPEVCPNPFAEYDY